MRIKTCKYSFKDIGWYRRKWWQFWKKEVKLSGRWSDLRFNDFVKFIDKKVDFDKLVCVVVSTDIQTICQVITVNVPIMVDGKHDENAATVGSHGLIHNFTEGPYHYNVFDYGRRVQCFTDVYACSNDGYEEHPYILFRYADDTALIIECSKVFTEMER